MGEGGGNASVPEFFLSGYFLDLLVDEAGGWHYQHPEVCRLKDDDIVIVLLPLIVVVAS